MTVGRVVLVVTFVLVAVLAGWFALLSWEQANRVATVVAALTGVAAAGIAVWTAVRGPAGRTVRVSNTGKATAGMGGKANTGVQARQGMQVDSLEVHGTGAAEAGRDGEANTGVRFD